MYPLLLKIHSILRFLILLSLVIVIFKSLIGMVNKQRFGLWDNKFSLYLLIFTHMQLLAGLILYFVSPQVKFGGGVMSNPDSRYWTVEHIVGMLVAVALITVGRVTLKRIPSDADKFKRLVIFNVVALVVIVTMIVLSHRGLLTMTALEESYLRRIEHPAGLISGVATGWLLSMMSTASFK